MEERAVIELRYGGGTQSAALPATWRTTWIRTAPPPAERSESFITEEALDAPVGAPPLRAFLAGARTLTVVVSDKTRRCRTDLFLPLLLRRVHAAGILPKDVTILFATGTHPAQTAGERRELLGEEIVREYRVLEHDCRDDAALVSVGDTRDGTPVRVHRALSDADRIIGAGAIVHHYFAGFGGGPPMPGGVR